jgi:hypothetical protein
MNAQRWPGVPWGAERVSAHRVAFQPRSSSPIRTISKMGRRRTGSTVAIVLAVASLVAMTLATAPSALAQWPRQCRADIGRICRAVAKDDDKTVLTCLQENAARLSRACQKLLQSYGHVPDTAGKRR